VALQELGRNTSYVL